MRMKLPITGTVTEVEPFIAGDPDDPIMPVRIDLGNIDWTLVGIDIEEETMEIELLPKQSTLYATGELNPDGTPEMKSRPTTPGERAAAIEHALDRSLARMSKQALYALSGSPPLKNPFKVDPD